MPIDDARRKQLEALVSGGSATTTPSVPGTLPPGIPAAQPYVSSLPLGRGGRLTIPPPQDVLQQQLAQKRAERQMQAETPLPTETERERTPMAQGAVAFIDQFAKRLGVDEQKGTVARQDLLAPSLVRELIPQRFQDYALSEESSMLYNDLESAFQLGSIVLTGRQGDLQKLQQIRDVYAFGGGVKEKPELIVQRIRNMRKLFQTFERAEAMKPEARERALIQASQQMDQMLGEADPNIATLQQQFPGAIIRRKR